MMREAGPYDPASPTPSPAAALALVSTRALPSAPAVTMIAHLRLGVSGARGDSPAGQQAKREQEKDVLADQHCIGFR